MHPLIRTVFATGLLLGLVWLGSCAPAGRTFNVATLERGTQVQPAKPRRVFATDPDALQPYYLPLGPRLGLIEIRAAADWNVVRQAAPGVGPAPDFSTGVAIGLVSTIGKPLTGQWPVTVGRVRLTDGAGLVEAHFNGGSYHPDGAVLMEITFVRGLEAVLVVDVDSTRFYPRNERGPQALGQTGHGTPMPGDRAR